MEYQEAQARQRATRQPGEVIVQPAEVSGKTEAYEALVGMRTHCRHWRVVWACLGDTLVVQTRHQTVRRQDEGRHASLCMVCQQYPADVYGVVLALQHHPTLRLGTTC